MNNEGTERSEDDQGFFQGVGRHQEYMPGRPGPDVLAGIAGRHWFWVLIAILGWRGYWLIIAHHGDDNRYIFMTYFMLYITYMLLLQLDEMWRHEAVVVH